MCPRRKMKTENYKNYGKCAVLERGGVKVMVTLDIGPRIIWFGTEDLNFMNEDLERNVSKGGEFFDEHYGKGTTWYLYGGHRVWKSPEDLETYTPDNVPVEAEERPSGGRFVCRAAKWLDYALDIELADDGTLTVKNTVENKGAERTLAVWGLTVARKGGTLVLVGYPAGGEMTLPVSLLLDKEISIQTVFRYRHQYPAAIEAVRDGKVDLKGLVTRVFALDDLQEALDASCRDKAALVKAVVKIS